MKSNNTDPDESLSPDSNSNGSGDSNIPPPDNLNINEVIGINNGPVPAGKLDKQFIKKVAASESEDGDAVTYKYAQASIKQINGQELKKLQLAKAVAEGSLEVANKNVNELDSILDKTERYQEDIKESTPMTEFDRIQIKILIIASILILGVGVNSNARVLMSTGLPAFADALSCYLYSMIPIILPFGLKALPRFIKHKGFDTGYRVGVWIVAILFCIIWVILFAKTFPNMAQPISHFIENMSWEDSNPQGADMAWVFIAVSIFAETFLAAGCWLTIESICLQHQPSSRVPNPAYETVREDIEKWKCISWLECARLGNIVGRIDALRGVMAKRAQEVKGMFLFYKDKYRNRKS